MHYVEHSQNQSDYHKYKIDHELFQRGCLPTVVWVKAVDGLYYPDPIYYGYWNGSKWFARFGADGLGELVVDLKGSLKGYSEVAGQILTQVLRQQIVTVYGLPPTTTGERCLRIHPPYLGVFSGTTLPLRQLKTIDSVATQFTITNYLPSPGSLGLGGLHALAQLEYLGVPSTYLSPGAPVGVWIGEALGAIETVVAQ